VDHLPSSVALHFPFESGPFFDRVQHCPDEWDFPTMAFMTTGQNF